MESTPKSLRLQIALFGRTNVGKSSLLNMFADQDIAIVSEMPGTTTDVVEKPLELLPIGPVVFLDTPGLDDTSELGEKRIERSKRILSRADIAIIVTEPNKWTDSEIALLSSIKDKNIPAIIVINKSDLGKSSPEYIETFKKDGIDALEVSSFDAENRDNYVKQLKSAIAKLLPKAEQSQNVSILGDLVPNAGGLVIFITPIDLQAPKGRLILPQVQAIRDSLDNDLIVIVVKEREYPDALRMLNKKPDLVVCDSQVVYKMVADTPDDVPCTTFSILFSRLKGDFAEEVRGAAEIDNIEEGDKILIAEACSHHSLEDDIGKVKIPRWLRQYLGFDVQIDFCNGRDYPKNLSEYKLIIHCGSCMITRTEKLNRIDAAKQVKVPITNYGMTISMIQGVFKRVLSPFPEILEMLK